MPLFIYTLSILSKELKAGGRGAEGAGEQGGRGAGEQGSRGAGEMSREAIKNHKDLEVYKKAFEAAMQIFELSKKFPQEERYSLTDRIRRSSRSVCANLAEGWRKRRLRCSFCRQA